MLNEKLNQIKTVAESFGFVVRIYKSGYATFEAPRELGKIRVDFEYNHVKNEYDVYVNWSSEVAKLVTPEDLTHVKEFTNYLSNAVKIADMLTGIKVNEAE